MAKRILAAAALALALAACDNQNYAGGGSTRHLAPIPPATMSLMATKGVSKNDPILIRAYKKEAELEVWKQGRDGRYALLKTYPICRWSGQLGPKVKEGDRQAPEGFYQVTPAQMNPNSSFYLSFDTGYPNAFDRAHGRTGSHLMVHGSCTSRGCFAMTDEAIAEVYALARESFAGGQRSFQFQSYPFRMTAQNLAKHRYDPHIAFWKNLKEGSDHFEVTKAEPKVAVCGKRYGFNTADCAGVDPSIAQAVAQKQAEDERKVAELVAKGTPAVKLVYEDGGGHQSFREIAMLAPSETSAGFPVLDARARRNLGDVSRPEALAMGPREILLDGPGRAKAEDRPATALAFAPAAATAEIRRPAPTAPVLARVALADEPVVAAPVPAAPAQAESRSIYDRMRALLPGAAPLSPAAEVETARAPATAAPLPPARPVAKPQAAKPAAERRVETLPGAQPPLASGFSRAN